MFAFPLPSTKYLCLCFYYYYDRSNLAYHNVWQSCEPDNREEFSYVSLLLVRIATLLDTAHVVGWWFLMLSFHCRNYHFWWDRRGIFGNLIDYFMYLAFWSYIFIDSHTTTIVCWFGSIYSFKVNVSPLSMAIYFSDTF